MLWTTMPLSVIKGCYSYRFYTRTELGILGISRDTRGCSEYMKERNHWGKKLAECQTICVAMNENRL